MKKTIAILLLMLMLTAMLGVGLSEERPGEDYYLMFVEGRENSQESSLRQTTAFDGLSCSPEDFKAAIKSSIDYNNPDEDGHRFHAALTALGFPMGDEAMQIFFSGYPGDVSTIDYGRVPYIDGEYTLRVGIMYMGGYRLLAVFLNDGSGWQLTDCLNADDFGIEDTMKIDLLTRDNGEPGAWLLLPSIGHGTGVYALYEEWYNVFTHQFEARYEREGFDEVALGDGASYIYATVMDMSIVDNKLPTVLPYTRRTSYLQSDHSDYAITELARHVVTGEYVYDATTASYSRQNQEIQEDAVAPSPATVFFENWR